MFYHVLSVSLHETRTTLRSRFSMAKECEPLNESNWVNWWPKQVPKHAMAAPTEHPKDRKPQTRSFAAEAWEKMMYQSYQIKK
jgi:hypothetical protein